MSWKENSGIIWCYGFENATTFRSDGIYSSHQHRLRFTNTSHDLIALGLRPSPEHGAKSRHHNPAMSLFTFIDDSVTIQAHLTPSPQHMWILHSISSVVLGDWRFKLWETLILTYATQYLASVDYRFSLSSWVAYGKVTMTYTHDVLSDGLRTKKHQCQVKFASGHLETFSSYKTFPPTSPHITNTRSGSIESLLNSSLGASKGSTKGVWAGYMPFRCLDVVLVFGVEDITPIPLGSAISSPGTHDSLRKSRLSSSRGQTNVVSLQFPLLIDDDDDDASPPTPLPTTPTRIRLLCAPTSPSQPFLLLMPLLSLLPPTPTPTQDVFTYATESRDSSSKSYRPERLTT
ncbi:hypothetical protein EDD18DRAFT_1334508, partial [Armillaria luteobubalina]